MLEEKEFGEAGERVVFEEYLEGQEASLMFFTDGISLKLMPTTQDHKALLAGDRGPNTGGMGAYTPVPGFTPELEQQCLETIAFRLLKALSSRGLPYHGVITANLMLTERGPYVLEFNARFGDPECEVVLPLLQTDLVDVIEAVLANRLSSQAVSWSSAAAMCVALASKGYPADSRSGNAISGIDQHVPHTITFHAGTAQQGDATVTAGGRVLLITATGQTLAEAREIVYDRVEQIHFDGMQYRRDIGWRALDTHSPWE